MKSIKNQNEGNCSDSKKILQLEYLFLDLETCNRCVGTDQVLDDVVKVITPALELAGYRIKYHKIEISTEDIAKEYRFVSSPTIRVNGRDICSTVAESNCGCCSDISGADVDCRVFEYKGNFYEIPPKVMLAEAILSAIFTPSDDKTTKYALPDNLKSFYEGKVQKRSSCSCTDGCCKN